MTTVSIVDQRDQLISLAKKRGYSLDMSVAFPGLYFITYRRKTLASGYFEELMEWFEADKPAALDRWSVESAVNRLGANPHAGPTGCPITLPNWQRPLHIGARVRAKTPEGLDAVQYTIVDIVEDAAVIVPLASLGGSGPHAYVYPLDRLKAI